MKSVFDHTDHHGNAAKRLLNLRQGSWSVLDFSVELHTLAADAKGNKLTSECGGPSNSL